MPKLFPPPAYLDVGVDEVSGVNLVVVDVPGGKDAPFTTDGKVFLRRGTATITASGHDIQAILQRRVAEVERWERRNSPVLTEDDLDLEEVSLTMQAARERLRIPLGGSSQDPFDVLNALGMTARGQFTNAADVCFGRDPARRHPQVRVRAFSFQTDKGGNYQDQQTFSGPIGRILDDIQSFILRQTPVAAEFSDTRLQRLDRPAYPTYVVREGLVNALAHRDYASFAGGVTVEVYPDHVEIWNTGKLPNGWDARKLRSPHPSLPSNPDIAHVLYVRGYMERIGRGTLKMIQTCQDEGLALPKWQADTDGVRLTLFSRLHINKDLDLNERQQTLLNKLVPGAAITSSDYHMQFAQGITERQARRDLSAMVEAGVLVLEGHGPTSRYVRAK